MPDLSGLRVIGIDELARRLVAAGGSVLLRARRTDLRVLLEDRWPLERLADAFEAFCAGHTLKPLIVVRSDLLPAVPG